MDGNVVAIVIYLFYHKYSIATLLIYLFIYSHLQTLLVQIQEGKHF